MLSVMFVVLAAESWLNKCFFFLQRIINALCKILLVKVVEFYVLCFVLNCSLFVGICV